MTTSLKSSIRRNSLQLGMPPAWKLFAPLILIILAVVGYPFFQTILLSFTNTKLLAGFGKSSWVGFENYGFALTDSDFLKSLLRTLYFTFTSVGAEGLLGVLVALLLNQQFPGRTICRSLLVLPWAIPTIVNALMWRLIYQPPHESIYYGWYRPRQYQETSANGSAGDLLIEKECNENA